MAKKKTGLPLCIFAHGQKAARNQDQSGDQTQLKASKKPPSSRAKRTRPGASWLEIWLFTSTKGNRKNVSWFSRWFDETWFPRISARGISPGPAWPRCEYRWVPGDWSRKVLLASSRSFSGETNVSPNVSREDETLFFPPDLGFTYRECPQVRSPILCVHYDEGSRKWKKKNYF